MHPQSAPNSAGTARRGMTLLELLVAMSIMLLVVGALAALAKGVQMGFEHGQGYGMVTQHGRVVIERITRIAEEATANESFPGVFVLAETQNGYRFPDTLVVWHPTGAPANPTGLPRYCELVIFCPNPSQCSQLLEITAPGDTRTVPAITNTSSWASNIQSIKSATTSTRVVLTTLLRTALVTSTDQNSVRGAVRFETRLRPSDAEWSQHTAHTLPWNQLAWPQGIYGGQCGLRQAWLRMELQLFPSPLNAESNTNALSTVPFFGSAAVYFPLTRKY